MSGRRDRCKMVGRLRFPGVRETVIMGARRFVFVDVDTQRDFLDPSGSLFIPGSERILASLARMTQVARNENIPVIATACAHTLDEADPEPFPPHCLIGTEGQRRIVETDWPGGMVLPVSQTLSRGQPIPAYLTLEKSRYSIFSRPDAGSVFALYAASGATFVVYGVATDYCVRAAVLGLRELGYPVTVVADAVWAIEQDRESEQFADFVEAGAVLILAEAVCELASGLSDRPDGI